MSRFSRYDTDEERLPEGMTRVGYDADTQVYTFQDADGSYWESAPGNEFGQLTRTGTSGHLSSMYADLTRPRPSWRRDMMPMMQFGVIIGLFLFILFWFLHGSAGGRTFVKCAADASKYTIQADDTCWAIAQARGIDIKDILTYNQGIDCERLIIGSSICLPESSVPV